MQGRDQCVRVLPEGHLSQTSDRVTDQLLVYEGGFFFFLNDMISLIMFIC